MIFVCIIFFVGWKVVKKTKFVPALECDLVWEKPIIDQYEASIEPPLGLWEDMWVSSLTALRIKKSKTTSADKS